MHQDTIGTVMITQEARRKLRKSMTIPMQHRKKSMQRLQR